jgi:hypothetical protein
MRKIIAIGNVTLLVLALAMVSCKKEESTPTPTTTTPTTPTATTASSTPQFTGSIDGTSVSHQTGYVGFSNSASVGSGMPSNFSYSGQILDAAFNTVISVEKGNLNLPGGGYPSNSEFSSFIPSGVYAFDATLMNGIVVTYYSGGTEWSSALGSGDQTGSVFTVVERFESTATGDFRVKYKATFNCKVYDGLGGQKVITNGVIVSSFENF